MAFDVRSTATTSGSGTTITLTAPSGTASTDGLFAFIVQDPNRQLTLPDGWSISTSVFGTTTMRVLRYSGTLPAGPWTVEQSAAGVFVAATVAITRDPTTGSTVPVIDVAATSVPASTTGAAVTPVVTPTTADDVILSIVGWERPTTFTTPVGVTERVDVSSGTTGTDHSLWIGSQALTGGTGVATTARSVANDNPLGQPAGQYVIATLAIKSSAPPASWLGDFETGDFSQYLWYQAAATDRITLRTDTPREGTRYARFFCQDDDVYPLTPTENPRAQLSGTRILFPGTTRWISWATRFPSDFPLIPVGGWFVFSQVHGPPYLDSPSLGMGVDPGDRLVLKRNSTYGYDTIWQAPMVRSSWLDFAWRVNFAQDETGWVELYYQGQQQTFSNGSRRLMMRTMEPSQNSGCEWYPTSYRKRGMFSTVTLDHDVCRIDSTIPPLLAATAGLTPTTKTTSTGVSGVVAVHSAG